MYGKAAILILAFLAIVSLNFGSPGEPISGILTLYHRADKLFHLSNSTPVSDSTALSDFERVIDDLQKNPGLSGGDTLLFQSYLKKGILLDVKYDYSGAREAYCQALRLHKQDDSLTFVASVYAGTSYYNLNNFDSSNYFLLKAESLASRFRDREDEVRLYNTLGVLYYDNGDYKQGNNYFNRALGIVKGKKPFDTASAVSLETNMATSFYRLGLYQESLSTYNKALVYGIFTDPIHMNMGMAYESLDKYREALVCFRKVDATKVPGVFNEMGYTLLLLHRPDSAAWFLDRLPLRSPENGPKLNELDLGINEFYRADLLADRQQYKASLASLQKAIIIFSRNFNKEDIFANPSNFTGSFASYRLFDALYKKATVFERLFKMTPKEEYLLASYEAYKAALSLLQYIERSYDTDDAKIFLKKKNREVYQAALTVCLELYRLHPGNNYLEQAFLIGEKNKASVMTANLEEKGFNKTTGIEGGLLQKERNCKYNIARLNVRSEETHDRKDMEKIAGEKAGYEIELSRLQKELEQDGGYYKLKYDDSSPGIKELQERLDNKEALISFYVTTEALHIFILTKSSFAYTRLDSLTRLQHETEDWLNALKTTENGRKFRGAPLGARLYEDLIKPIQSLIPGKDEWIIIPDGFLYFLPLESLPAGEGAKTLLETTTISYRFSSRLLAIPGAPDLDNNSSVKVLAFAPFAGKQGGAGQAGSNQSGAVYFSRLPASGEEIAGAQGNSYLDSFATKERFLAEINKYPIIHLATHAVSSINDASASYIAFYPQKKSSMEDCLFLEELYGLNLNATQLVIISACETGQGELVSNEGVISLARAFAYAGCESTISSLWKADDKATSFILRRFYGYLREGYTKSKALQHAKLDYLRSDAINKSPAYWSHLILIGSTAPVYPVKLPYQWGFLVIPFGILFFAVRKERGKRKKKSTLSKDGGFKII
jgi:CHAT domain-containing protein